MRPQQIRTLDSYILCGQGRENTGIFTQSRGLWTTWRHVNCSWDGDCCGLSDHWHYVLLWEHIYPVIQSFCSGSTAKGWRVSLRLQNPGSLNPVKDMIGTFTVLFTEVVRSQRYTECLSPGEWVPTQNYPAANQSKRFVVRIATWMDFKNDTSKWKIRKQNEMYNIYVPFI